MKYLQSKLALQLWLAMMLLVLFGVAFLWIVQIRLFEPSYANATLTTMENSLAQIINEVNSKDLQDRENSLHYLSQTINGKVFLVDENGKVLFVYSGGARTRQPDLTPMETGFIDDHFYQVVNGNPWKEIIDTGRADMTILMGVPVVYEGKPSSIFVTNTISEIKTLQGLNRNQLLLLSIALTMVASLMAVILTRLFVKPIYKIKSAVDRLAEGDLTAKPMLERYDELGQLSRAVEALGQALQRVDRLRKDVIANVSHELRAPLSLIIGYGEMVRDITWNNNELREKNLNLIVDEAQRLSQMVDDIMDYSQFQSGYITLHKESTNLYEIVDSEVEFARQIAAEYHIQIKFSSFSEKIRLTLDPLKMSQVLRNLLNNAINHTADGKTISVSISGNGLKIRVSVINPGEPIPDEAKEIIWERFQRVQHQGGRKEGTGIGLAIVSTILSAHSIEYGVESDGGNNAFWFEVTKEQER